MREGELFINVTSLSSADPIFPRSSGVPTNKMFGVPAMATGEGPFWREQTGQKKGWLIKREETQTLKILGTRCIECGFIELYVQK